MEQEKKKYQWYAFISYSHEDMMMAKKLERFIDSFKLPSHIHNEIDKRNKYLRPNFRDQTELEAGNLNKIIKRHLSNSIFLIVCCSPNASKSDYVNKEIEYYINSNSEKEKEETKIIPVIFSGKPHSDNPKEECFPPALLKYMSSHHLEYYAPNKKELESYGEELLYAKVVAGMLGINVSSVWDRHQKEKRKKKIRLITLTFITSLITILSYLYLIRPINFQVTLEGEGFQLPMFRQGILKVNKMEYTINNLDTTITIGEIPGILRGRIIDIEFKADYFKQITTSHTLDIGHYQQFVLKLHRDSTYAVYAGKVVYGRSQERKGVPNAIVAIEDSVTRTDNNGFFKIVFPVEKQSKTKSILVKKDDFTYTREDESPSNSLIIPISLGSGN